MTSEIIDPGSPNGELTVDLGSGQLVSMKAVQQIYSEITGRSETLERTYKSNHAIGFDDLRQLHAKVQQLYEQYNIVSKTCSVTLFHVDDQKQTFSSFERFELFDRTTLSPVENVRIEFNFLIVLPQMKKPQSYQIEINIHSRAAIVQKARTNPNFRSDMFFEFFSQNTAHVEITYIDYTVARNFQVAINSWFKALPELATPRLLTPIRKLSGYYIFLFRFISVLVYLLGCYVHFARTLGESLSTPAALFSASLVTFGGMFLISVFTGKLGSVAAESVKRLQCKSYLNLTRGDEIAIKDFGRGNAIAWLKVGGSLLLAIAVNVFSTWLATRVGVAP